MKRTNSSSDPQQASKLKKARAKIGPGGPKHWRPTRDAQKAETRSRIAAAIANTKGFPTRASVLRTGRKSFGESSIDRHIDLVDAAQVAFNAELVSRGGTPMPLRKSAQRGAGKDIRLEEERARSADLALRLDKAESAIASKDEYIAELEERVARLETAVFDISRTRDALGKGLPK